MRVLMYLLTAKRFVIDLYRVYKVYKQQRHNPAKQHCTFPKTFAVCADRPRSDEGLQTTLAQYFSIQDTQILKLLSMNCQGYPKTSLNTEMEENIDLRNIIQTSHLRYSDLNKQTLRRFQVCYDKKAVHAYQSFRFKK